MKIANTRLRVQLAATAAAAMLALLPQLALAGPQPAPATGLARYVDPTIGTENLGNVFIGPSRPYGMVKPGPDFLANTNSGYAAGPDKPLLGFSQVHVSGTGGAAKYGNISLMPFSGPLDRVGHRALRTSERAQLGYYGITLDSGIEAEMTAARKVALYRFSYPAGQPMALEINPAHMLEETIRPRSPGQTLVGSEIEIITPTEVRGYGRVRGGWNKGPAYTVYFAATFSAPVRELRTWAGDKLEADVKVRPDVGGRTGALLGFGSATATPLQVKVGISFLSAARARQNIDAEVPDWDFDAVLADTRNIWNRLLGRIELGEGASIQQRRMLYTGLYHSMLMPTDRTGENPLWEPGQPYYDDFYAIWDTYRSMHPLITLIDPQRQADFVNALIDIQRHEQYLPDARSGNASGTTQGGSNADILIADAYVKGLTGIDYERGLKAMLVNADLAPGGDQLKEGRGGLDDYNTLGYVSSRYERAGTRTVEYALNDYAIATVAKGLGHAALAERFTRQSGNWKNLWRNVSDLGATGFLMPRNPDGSWVDEVVCTVPGKGKRPYAPRDVDVGRCVCWLCGFLYEGASWEYSLAVPHDVVGLIAASGGPDAFRRRLDTFFDRNLYVVSNEPSFLTPNLYHWLGRPDLSSDRIRAIIARHYNDTAGGLPGNDDSGAMSSWLVFHMLGLYPNAGQPVYLINSPLVPDSTLKLQDGRSLHIVARGFGGDAPYIVSARLNQKPLTRAWLLHSEIMAGGVLELQMGAQPAGWGSTEPPPSATALSTAAAH